MHASTRFAWLLLAAGACQTAPESQSAAPSASASELTTKLAPDVAITESPYSQVHANYKHRLEQPYVFVEHTGSYVETGRLLPELHQRLRQAQVEVSGPPFALFYDDPGTVAVARLRSRACFPVDGPVAASDAWKYEVLPSTSVAYAVVRGPYPDVPRAYPGLFAYVARMGWTEDGPIREVYLVAPGDQASFADLLCEVQVPVASAR